MTFIQHTAFLPLLGLWIATVYTASVRLSQFTKYGKSFVLAGGNLHDDNHPVWNQIVEMAGGKGVARIGVISAASSTPVESFKAYREIFLKHGASDASFIPITVNQKGNNSNPDVVKLIHQMTGFFFSGGDQARIIQSFFNAGHTPSPAMLAIAERNKLGAVVSGSSAGTTCQTASVMIEGGDSYDALRYGSHTSSSHSGDLLYNPNGGTGLLAGFVLDTHFGNRGREGRLIRLLSDTKNSKLGVNFGIGVDENTALVIKHAEDSHRITGQVIGELGVTIIDVSKSYQDTTSKYFSIHNVYVTYLTNGDIINLKSHKVTFSPTKVNLLGHEKYDDALTSDDIFRGVHSLGRKGEFLRVAASIFDSRKDLMSWGTTYDNHPQFKVTMSKTGQNCTGAVERHSGFHSDMHSYKNMYLEITSI
ncbi:hypothetical protein LOTGIDRAFT_163664 [Lottia gigantea]|uniref:Cyanophycinase n=1 Tax=Lottia gigantea TaxID=225164 RepID=V4A265_LOTGI|nr:hypothetical protein LOTGIDRAFT_163664 [Lottia gigantea]ESO90782.1 hypothetical protein LOTGIDRAFT_163664 [Lottia gigantea]